MEFAIRHFVAGRVRLYVPSLCRRRPLAEASLAWLRAQAGVKRARINYDCSSLVVEYDVAHEPLLRAIVGRLALMDLDDLRGLVMPAGNQDCKPSLVVGAAHRPEASPSQSLRAPLALPTLSLLLAFSANPIVRAINLPLMLWNGYPIAMRAWRVWCREGRLNVDFLDTLAILASLAQGNPLAGAIVTWLIKLGDGIRDLTAARSRRAVRELLEFQAKTAWVVRDGAVVSIPAPELAVGDEVVVYPGEMIPVDGEIIHGRALIDQKTITGESLPVTRGQGEAAFAATVIRDGQLTIRAIRVGSQTTAGQIAHLVESAPIGDTRMQNHAERLADRLVVPTLALATGTAALSADFNRFLNLVIVDYGTGIRVAAPTAVLSFMTNAARNGIIIKSGRHIERLAEVDTIVFDKTGTLTHGTPAVRDVLSYQDHITPTHLLGLAAAAEARLQHPVASALRERAKQLGSNVPPCDETQYRAGLGVEGRVNGYYVHVGNERFMRESNISVRKTALDRAALDEQGCSCVYIAVDGAVGGLVPYADEVRAESRSILQRLHALGVRNSIMLTGDNAVVARAVGKRLGLTRQFADMMPADKATVIQDLQRSGHVVAMVGDGINDSPALSYADVGIAMKHGAEVTHESAHVVLMEDSLWKLVKAVEISKGTIGLIKQNYAIVAGMNTVALALALPSGLSSPVFTAMISNGSAILASLNGLRPLLWQR
jgi:heavy metal translocating P-type ATPase